MFLSYLKERYQPEDFLPITLEEVAAKFEEVQNHQGFSIFKTDKSFMTYKLEGDAAIFADMYVEPTARKDGEAWRMFNALLNVAKDQKKRVAITFSEALGRNQNLGLFAIHAMGFKPAYKIGTSQMYIKGI